VRGAIESWKSNARVAVIASGGLSHFVIDEELDRQILKALQAKDADALCSLPRGRLNSGTSEIRNWIAAAGAVEHLPMTLIDYVPCYRSPAGTGCAMAFAQWT
jgi:predicted class III extradiol MEMO1 family dioxygenase